MLYRYSFVLVAFAVMAMPALAQSTLLDYGSPDVSGTPTYAEFGGGANTLLDQPPNQVNGVFSEDVCSLCGGGPQILADNFSFDQTDPGQDVASMTWFGGNFPGNTPPFPHSFRFDFFGDAGGIPDNDNQVCSVQRVVTGVVTGVVLFDVDELQFDADLDVGDCNLLDQTTYWVSVVSQEIMADSWFWETANAGTGSLAGTTFHLGDGDWGDVGGIDYFAITIRGDDKVDCEFNLRVMNPEVDPGDALSIRFHLQHNRPRTVHRAFFLEILDADATMLFRRQSRIMTIEYQDEINRNWALNLPDLEPGVYTLAMGIEGMTQGRVLAERPFTVMPGARQAPSNSVALPEYLDGEWIPVAAVGALPSDYVLTQNYPNPFNPSTEIGFALPESAHVRLVVYDVLGRQVRLLLDGTMEAGTHQVVFDASDLPSGTYLYRLETPQGSVVRTMLLAK